MQLNYLSAAIYVLISFYDLLIINGLLVDHTRGRHVFFFVFLTDWNIVMKFAVLKQSW